MFSQVKIWFQNRRTKWKKQNNITNAEATEHKNHDKKDQKDGGAKKDKSHHVIRNLPYAYAKDEDVVRSDKENSQTLLLSHGNDKQLIINDLMYPYPYDAGKQDKCDSRDSKDSDEKKRALPLSYTSELELEDVSSDADGPARSTYENCDGDSVLN